MIPRFCFLALLAWGFTALAEKTGDNCAPPPSALAPTLPAKLLDGMGIVHLPITTTSAEAQKFFDQGLAQMHSFWAREAERSFLQAAALDSQAPMPWWGVAMVAGGDWRPRFQIDFLDSVQGKAAASPSMTRARVAAQKAVELSQVPGKATDLEKMYIAAVAGRRDPNVRDPEEALVKGLRAVASKYPDEVEAQLDLALMIMRGFSAVDRKPRAPGSMEAVAILRRLAVKVPEHPGVHHYIIHGWEGSSFAKEAWPSCEKYAQLVTNIPHALHMPGHIYSQTGRWDDAAKAFASAAENERYWMKQDKLYGDGHHGHNVHYLATAYSFEGRYDDAVEAARELLTYHENPKVAVSADYFVGAYAQGWSAMLRTQVQFEKWDVILDGQTVPVFPRPRQEAWRHWARSLAYANTGNLSAADGESRQFEQSLNEYRNRTHRPDPPELEVARKELAGQLEVARGHADRGLKLLEAASKAERRLTYAEPPWYPRPVAEALGKLAVKHNRNALAEKAFRIALDQYPADAHAQTALNALLEQARPNQYARSATEVRSSVLPSFAASSSIFDVIWVKD
jgi:tetratricopeptide (TPR) repeat protein